ncbi:UbiA prenyltransferase family protein [Crocinitomix catalasitica]|uniref:hypothetical protein n=1 Tax=Crocinitomix catalasitica TaxID=184607 RepID=UPI000481701C|nr:hypothetical protein [Crocinitomix catalasitica]
MIKEIGRLIVYSNFWISLGAACFVSEYYLIFDVEPNWYFIHFIGASTFLTYSFQRYIKLKQKSYLKNDRFVWMKQFDKLSKFLMVIAFVVALFCLIKLDLFHWRYLNNGTLILIIMGFVSFFYIIRIPFFLSSNLRDIPYIKIYLIAIVWTLSATYLPNIYAHLPLINELHLFALACFCFIVAITIPFDLRDLDVDSAHKKTIPQLAGIKGAQTIAIALIIISTVLLSILLQEFLIITSIATLGMAYAFTKAKPDQKDLFFSFGIDGFLILHPLAIYMDLILL